MKKQLLGFFFVLFLVITGCSFDEPSGETTYIPYSAMYEITNETASNLTGILVADGSLVNVIAEPDSAVVGISDTQELTNKTLNAVVGKGTWTNSGIWTLPAFVLNGDITTNGKYFDSGTGNFKIKNNGTKQGLLIETTYSGIESTGITFRTISDSPAIGDYPFNTYLYAKDGGGSDYLWGLVQYWFTDVSDGTETMSMAWTLQYAGSRNKAMELSGNGILSVDDSYDTFDDYDDALILKRGISEGNKELMLEVGVLKLVDVKNDSGDITGQKYMIQLQAFNKLLAGGVYQNRDKIDALEARIANLEKLLEGK